MMEIKGLCFHHIHSERPVIEGLCLEADRGEMTTILGPNGSGKTTLFRCIAGLWRQRKGEILFEGRDISNLSHGERARMLALVPQEHEPPFPYSVLDAVLMGRAPHVGMFSTPSKEDFLKAEEALETVGIAHLGERPYTRISGGERQLVLIARALSQESPVLLLDEPTAHLDFRNQVVVLKKVRKIAGEKRLAVLMTLHDPNLAMLFSDRVVMIRDGHVVSTGAPQTVISGDNLKKVYGIDVAVVSYNGTGLVCPRINPE